MVATLTAVDTFLVVLLWNAYLQLQQQNNFFFSDSQKIFCCLIFIWHVPAKLSYNSLQLYCICSITT